MKRGTFIPCRACDKQTGTLYKDSDGTYYHPLCHGKPYGKVKSDLLVPSPAFMRKFTR